MAESNAAGVADMSRYKNEQHHIHHNGRSFHFISYEGQNGSVSQGVPPTPPSWFLVNAGKRWQVMPQVPDQTEEELNRLLTEWLEVNITS
jgi:hypothetical protein